MAHYWAHEDPRAGPLCALDRPAYVKPFVKQQKNDAADAANWLRKVSVTGCKIGWREIGTKKKKLGRSAKS